ncbi:Uncharacterized protein FWK35_00016676 [Aphis craccivora]|uniref:MULE domain-containing protein n=1 Tax=Aphis craccivora TaxID=307492 RepID=A0A6G0YLP7_APHCR|nr:Uncharacterized protein FWK35_00016676 [Aphis craccivora]
MYSEKELNNNIERKNKEIVFENLNHSHGRTEETNLNRQKKIDLFLDYLVDNYISSESTFPPRIWAEFSHSTFRSTNNCESFNSKFNGIFYHAHPNIYQFIEALKYIQQDSYIKLRSTIKQRNPILAKEDFIKEKIYKYSSSQISRLEFVKEISFKFNSISNF